MTQSERDALAHALMAWRQRLLVRHATLQGLEAANELWATHRRVVEKA